MTYQEVKIDPLALALELVCFVLLALAGCYR